MTYLVTPFYASSTIKPSIYLDYGFFAQTTTIYPFPLPIHLFSPFKIYPPKLQIKINKPIFVFRILLSVKFTKKTQIFKKEINLQF